MTSFFDQLRREPLQLGSKYHSIDDYYNTQFPEPESSRSATDPWSEEELAFQPVARPELCHPERKFMHLTDAFLKGAGYKSIDAYFKAAFPPESAEQPGPPLAEPVDLGDRGLSASVAFAFSAARPNPETKLPSDPAWEEYFAQPHNTFELLLSFSKLAAVRPVATQSPHASERRLADHAESYQGILEGKCRPTLFAFNAEERRRKVVKFFRACQRELSAKALGAFASWLSESWGTERFHRAGHRASKGPRCVTHAVGCVWSIQGDSDDYLVVFQSFGDRCAFLPLAYFPSGNLTLFVDFLVSLRAVWWGFHFPAKKQQQGVV